MRFEWDAAKAAGNVRKHGVAFSEAEEVFGDFFSLTGDDVAHSQTEQRERTVGRSSEARLLVVVTAVRKDVIRIISVRIATVGEVNAYEKAIEEKLRNRR